MNVGKICIVSGYLLLGFGFYAGTCRGVVIVNGLADLIKVQEINLDPWNKEIRESEKKEIKVTKINEQENKEKKIIEPTVGDEVSDDETWDNLVIDTPREEVENQANEIWDSGVEIQECEHVVIKVVLHKDQDFTSFGIPYKKFTRSHYMLVHGYAGKGICTLRLISKNDTEYGQDIIEIS